MQPLPVLTEAQVNVVGPVQPAGSALKPVVIDRFVAVLPSLVVNVTLNEALDPTTTSTALVVDDVATMLSLVVAGAEDPPPPPHADKAATLATMAQRLSNFDVLIMGSSRSVYQYMGVSGGPFPWRYFTPEGMLPKDDKCTYRRSAAREPNRVVSGNNVRRITIFNL